MWSFGLEIQRDWAAAGLALPEDAELHAILQAVTCTVKELEGKGELHIFADSLTALRWTVDPSLHSSQVHSLNFLWHVWPWLHGQADTRIVLHYVDKDVGLDMHSLVHLLATSTKVEAGGGTGMLDGVCSYGAYPEHAAGVGGYDPLLPLHWP